MTSRDAPTTVAQMLDTARAGLRRLTPQDAHAAMRAGAVVLDIRSDHQRARDGVIAGARLVRRNVLEWRADPASPHRDPSIARPGAHVVLLCDEGYQSSLAAATLQRLGLPRATDVLGGFQAWRAPDSPCSRARPRGPSSARAGIASRGSTTRSSSGSSSATWSSATRTGSTATSTCASGSPPAPMTSLTPR